MPPPPTAPPLYPLRPRWAHPDLGDFKLPTIRGLPLKICNWRPANSLQTCILGAAAPKIVPLCRAHGEEASASAGRW